MPAQTRYTESRLNQDHVAAFRFYIEIEGIIKGWFTECTGLSVEREIFEYKEGGVNNFSHKLPVRTKYANLTLKHGMADDELWKWFDEGSNNGLVSRQRFSILLYDASKTKVKRWNVFDAYPVKWVGPELKSDSSQAAIETLEIAHHGLEMEGWKDA
ncbi:MAG: phage tail protein [Chloroflexota bacterium]|nr:MAG: phage tail protein [Chloroflexota bacterium]